MNDFFTQNISITESKVHSHDFCMNLCAGKKVLHIGCSDYPLYMNDTNLHIRLSKVTMELHGCDPEGTDILSKFYNGVYFTDISQVSGEYDIILVPNVLEHLPNPGLMIKQLFGIGFETMFILVPNYTISSQSEYNGTVFTEKVHPDHYCWFSPYTLYKTFKDYISGMKYQMMFFDGTNMVGMIIKNYV